MQRIVHECMDFTNDAMDSNDATNVIHHLMDSNECHYYYHIQGTSMGGIQRVQTIGPSSQEPKGGGPPRPPVGGQEGPTTRGAQAFAKVMSAPPGALFGGLSAESFRRLEAIVREEVKVVRESRGNRARGGKSCPRISRQSCARSTVVVWWGVVTAVLCVRWGVVVVRWGAVVVHPLNREGCSRRAVGCSHSGRVRVVGCSRRVLVGCSHRGWAQRSSGGV